MTTSTRAILGAVRDYILDFAPAGGGTTLRTRLGGGANARCYTVQPDEVPAWPYVLLRWESRRQTLGFGGLRDAGVLEVMIYHQRRRNQWEAEGLADLLEEALLRYVNDPATAGLVFGGHVGRDTFAPLPDPLLRDLVTIRLTVPLAAWPVYRTQYVTP